ncbi:MAG TPA: ABC-2 family transporter protein [Candidatus Acidoferrum sp.]|nr:ABC-2 family transporter protein [Candidatus Acidoferrum sp.]
MPSGRTASPALETWRAALRAAPAMLRIGVAETVAYRAEFVVWMLTTTLPLIMLGLWTSVASEAPFARFSEREFVAYYLGALIVRNLTSSWVVWQLNEEIRRGMLSFRLLRPVHPFFTYAASHISAVPLRSLVAIPFALVLLFSSAREILVTDPLLLVVLAFSLLGAWLVTFFVMVMIGSVGLFVDKSVAVFDVYFGIFAVMSGYLVPLALLPGWAREIAAWLPFRFMLAFPVELAIGEYSKPGLGAAAALRDLAIQWGWVVLIIGSAVAVWRAGIRRYEAFGS